MSIEVDKQQLLDQLFTLCDESRVKKVWVVGSVVKELDEEFTSESDIDMYISVVDESDKTQVEESVAGRPEVEVLGGDGETVPRVIDVHAVFEPEVSPGSARGRPVENIY